VSKLTDDGAAAPGSTQDLILTLFGEYLLERPEPVWVGHLIELLETLRVTPSAVRTALSRMQGKGWLTAVREGRRSFYSLTPTGKRLLEEGRERIHHPPRGKAWSGDWSVITYTVPEEQREIRDRLRVRLTWLGCGPLGNGVWLSPHDVEAPIREIAETLRIREGLHLFKGEFEGPGDPRELISRCWDLAEVDRKYRRFLARHRPALDRSLQSRERFGRLCPAESFLLRFHLIHEYRRFPFIDPYLPSAFLPEEWAGDEAAEFFETFHGLLAGPAEEHVAWVLTDQGGRRTA
jgi:phenylacetic acid degradation operon negative regulatory protein